MAEFVIKIADDRGRVQQHIEQGYSEAEVRDRFSQQGYLVYSVKPRGIFSPGRKMGRGRIRQGSFLVFNQQFLTLIHAGLPIVTALELLIKRQRNASLKAVLENVRRYRAIASLYRQTAAFRPPQRFSLLEQAKEWERLALAELESYFSTPRGSKYLCEQ